MNVRLVHSAEDDTKVYQKDRMIRTLRGLLQETCTLRNQGAPYAKLTHSQGYADGYMRMMTDSGLIDDVELLAIIRDVRRGVDGPSTARVEYDSFAATA